MVSVKTQEQGKRMEPGSIGVKPNEIYEKIGAEIGRLVSQKQIAYGDSFGRSGAVMRTLFPNGIPLESYDDALTIVRIVDKLFRIASSPDAFGEDPYRDIAGYGILGSARRMEKQMERNVAKLKVELNRAARRRAGDGDGVIAR